MEVTGLSDAILRDPAIIKTPILDQVKVFVDKQIEIAPANLKSLR